jgi:hypothetical protein
MNEIEPWKVTQPLEVEVELVDIGCPDPPDPEPEVWRPGYTSIQPNEKRASHRYPAVGDGGRSWLGWFEGNHFLETPAWILNISAGGCLIAVDAPAPPNRSVWLRLDTAAVPDWVEVRIIDHQRTKAGLLASRIAFSGTCPYEMIKAVAFGLSRRAPMPEPARSRRPNS